MDKETRDKKTSELSSTIQRLEEEVPPRPLCGPHRAGLKIELRLCWFQLSEAVQVSTQASAELSLQQKLRNDDQIRMEELEEALLEKDQEVQKLQALVVKLQGEVGSARPSTWASENTGTQRVQPQGLCGLCVCRSRVS